MCKVIQICLPVCNTSNQVNTIFLHLFMSVLQNRCESWEQVFNRRSHFVHAYIDDEEEMLLSLKLLSSHEE